MAFVDVVMLLLVLILTIVGFFKGTVKIAIAIITFYLSIILASLYYRFLAIRLATNSEASLQVLDMLSFLIILVIFYMILLFTGLYSFKYVQVRGRSQILNNMIGAVLGLFLGAMFASVFAMMMRYLFITNYTEATLNFPFMRSLAQSTRNSVLKDLFLNGILPVLYGPISPIMPESADRIFRSLQQ